MQKHQISQIQENSKKLIPQKSSKKQLSTIQPSASTSQITLAGQAAIQKSGRINSSSISQVGMTQRQSLINLHGQQQLNNMSNNNNNTQNTGSGQYSFRNNMYQNSSQRQELLGNATKNSSKSPMINKTQAKSNNVQTVQIGIKPSFNANVQIIDQEIKQHLNQDIPEFDELLNNQEPNDYLIQVQNTSMSNQILFNDHDEGQNLELHRLGQNQYLFELPRSNISFKKPTNQSECSSPYLSKIQSKNEQVEEEKISQFQMISKNQNTIQSHSSFVINKMQQKQEKTKVNEVPYQESNFSGNYDTNNSSLNIGEEKTLKDDQKEIRCIQLAQYAIQNVRNTNVLTNAISQKQISTKQTKQGVMSPIQSNQNSQFQQRSQAIDFKQKTPFKGAIQSPNDYSPMLNKKTVKPQKRLKKGKSESSLSGLGIIIPQKQHFQNKVLKQIQQAEQSEFISPFDSEIVSQQNLNVSHIHIDNDQEYQIMKPNKSPLLKKAPYEDSTFLNQFEFDDEQHDFDIILSQ
eukprot:403340859